MKKLIVVVFALAAVSLVFFSSRLLAQEQPESVTLEGGSFGSVTFSHKGHTESSACKDCHHMGETPVQKCDSCHTADSKLNTKDAYHKNCIDCHKTKEKGPTGCMECHKK